MTLPSELTKVSYNGNGSTTVFTVTFIFWDNTAVSLIVETGLDVDGSVTPVLTLSAEDTNSAGVSGIAAQLLFSAETDVSDQFDLIGSIDVISDANDSAGSTSTMEFFTYTTGG